MQLRDGTTHQGAVTSMEPNEDTFIFHSEMDKVLQLLTRESSSNRKRVSYIETGLYKHREFRSKAVYQLYILELRDQAAGFCILDKAWVRR